MTVNETGMILAKIRATYPNWKVQDAKATAIAWTDILKNQTYEDVNKAFIIYARQGKEFAPNAGQLISIIQKYKPKSKNALDLLQDIKQALKNATYGAESEFERLPKEAQRVIGSPAELRRLSHSGINSFVENSLISRLEESIDLSEIRQEVLALENQVNVMIEDKGKWE